MHFIFVICGFWHVTSANLDISSRLQKFKISVIFRSCQWFSFGCSLFGRGGNFDIVRPLLVLAFYRFIFFYLFIFVKNNHPFHTKNRSISKVNPQLLFSSNLGPYICRLKRGFKSFNEHLFIEKDGKTEIFQIEFQILKFV